MMIVYVRSVPATYGPGAAVFVTFRSASAWTVTCAVGELLALFGSVVAEPAVAVFEIVVPSAVAESTVAVIFSFFEAPAAMSPRLTALEAGQAVDGVHEPVVSTQ